jgi:hypothetical protein
MIRVAPEAINGFLVGDPDLRIAPWLLDFRQLHSCDIIDRVSLCAI